MQYISILFASWRQDLALKTELKNLTNIFYEKEKSASFCASEYPLLPRPRPAEKDDIN